MTDNMVKVPDFQLASFYYPEILSALRIWLRKNAPEIVDENEFEIAVQLLKAFALVGHLNNCNIDLAANEALFGSAKLLESVRLHLKLIGVEPASARPAQTRLFAELTKLFDSQETIIPNGARFGTEALENEPARIFEHVNSAIEITTSIHFTHVFAFDSGSNTFTDRTTEANNGATWQPWTNPVEQNDALYFGHSELIFPGISFNSIGTAGADYLGVWETHHDLTFDMQPDSVSLNAGVLIFVVDSLVGPGNASGAEVFVRSNITGAIEKLIVKWNGTNNYIESTALLGQSEPSIRARDYAVGVKWRRLENLTDSSSGFTVAGDQDLAFDTGDQFSKIGDLTKTEVNGVEAFWLRFRVTAVSTSPSSPTFNGTIDPEKRVVVWPVVQGQTIEQDPLIEGGAAGIPNETVTLGQRTLIDGTLEIYVNDTQWTEVDNFLNSSSVDQHFTVETDAEGVSTITFGDGTNGALLPAGANVRAVYRIGAEDDGNVAAGTITRNLSGVPGLAGIANPQTASGWRPKQGYNSTDLERLKIEGPASIRALGRITTLEDCESLLVSSYEGTSGQSPVARAKAFLDEFGLRTIGIAVVGRGGNTLDSSTLADLQDWLNGSDAKNYINRVLLNYEAKVYNFTPRTITIEANIKAEGITASQIKTALVGFMNPLALHADAKTYRWEWGAKIPRAKIIAVIDEVAPDKITDIQLVQPASDVYLAAHELPYVTANDITITVEA